ncbi:alpha-glucosidase [Roseivivax sp. THAF40]|uniref:amylo-alpha-1,6-glucosidase n=1 Tax=unclassified Roseivivax TaxID=2639302 RepID=UPI00126846BE|nr:MULTISPECIES: trehalase family glycosidase [unclassified Roseivivax]QFS81702.1 alpha-glucosidase [Roseivivax sp. THAF197b]QFT45502.1 alpha-glucosidase [Roseivivax sp. THAF40]
MSDTRIEKAFAILRENDRGTYTVPTKGLYPFQWNWDSCLTALGFGHFDEARAWTEIDTLFAHQWEDGMVPHIVFHKEDDGYFPGPSVWQTGREVPTSGITQPAVAGFALNRLFERACDTDLARDRACALLPKVAAWHEWFYRCRDPQGTGLVAIIHPWESGRDNSVDWDAALGRVPTEGVAPFTRRDTQHANPEHRPTQAQYEAYIALVQHFRDLDWDNSVLHDASPFRVVDPGFNAILIRSCSDLARLAEALGETRIAERSRTLAERGIAALETLWSDTHGQYLCFDRAVGKRVESPSVGGLLPVFAAVPKARATAIARRIDDIGTKARFMVPSHDPASPDYDGKRYWRGPLWLIVNYMIADGLKAAGEASVVDRIVTDSLNLIEQSGFAEYYDPKSGEPCGGGRFTWTAAMVIEFLTGAKEDA